MTSDLPDILRPSGLNEGDLVAVVSPASFPADSHINDMVDELEGWGLRVAVGEHALAEHGPMAGHDRQRLADLNRAFADPSVRAIFASRGGMGSYRIVDGIDIDVARADPKPVIGFSDITNLFTTLWAELNMTTIHGCIGRHRGADDIRQMLMEGASLTIEADADGLTSPIRVEGEASGPLIGGNLRELAGSVGVNMPPLDGAIVFLEDLRHVGIGQVDRNLTQLLRSGVLDNVAGIALGLFEGFDDYVDRDWHLLDVLNDRLTNLGIPVLGGIKAGHGGQDAAGNHEQRSLCFGAIATIDTQAGTLAMGRCTRS